MINLKNLTIKKAHKHLVDGDFTAVELAESYIKNIEEKNKDINAYIEVFSDWREQAKKADERFATGEKDNLLLGIPFSIKDNILIKDRKVTAASKVLEGYVAPYDATVISKLKEKGVVFLGRVNMDEFAMGASTEHSVFGVTRNPLDLSRVAGGTSGGSTASVAGDMSLVSLGSDTGGSIRQPASFCGVVGFKPSYGRVSRHGLIAMGSSFDQIGPVTNAVSDAKIVLGAIEGEDDFCATSISKPENKKEIKRKIGICPALMDTEGLDEEVKENFKQAVEKIKRSGFEIVEVGLPNIKYSIPVYYVLIPAEVSSNMARFDGVKYGKKVEGNNLLEDYLKTRGELIGKEVRRRILIGTYVLSSGYYDAFYSKATKIRNLIKQDFEEAFKTVDVVLTPTTAGPAFKVGEKSNDPLKMYLEDVFTSTANLAGLPAISIPSGKTKEGLPLGLHCVGQFNFDENLLEIAEEFEGIL